jgi:hypothetical protein
MDADKSLELARKAFPNNENLRVAYMLGIEKGAENLEDAVDDAKDLAMRDLAWNVHVMISEGKSIGEIDHYVCGICDF